jgi:hypothetical protein
LYRTVQQVVEDIRGLAMRRQTYASQLAAYFDTLPAISPIKHG